MNKITAFSRFLPARPLRGHICYYWQINLPSPRTDDRLELTLPDLHGEVIFNFSGPYLRKNIDSSLTTLVAGSNIVGMRTHSTASMRRHAGERLELIGVKLYPWVLAGLTGCSSRDFLNQVVSFSDVAGCGFAELEARLFDASSPVYRLQLLDEYFLSEITERSSQELWLQQVLTHWVNAPHKSVTETARKFNLSPRTLERRCLSMLGTTPKKVQRLLRFNAWLATKNKPDRAQTGQERAAFYDQSHLNRECRFFLDATPGQVDRSDVPFTLNTFVA